MTVKVVVAGDVSVDWYYWPRSPYSNSEDTNWKLYEGISTSPQPGGAVLIAEMLSSILQCEKKDSPYSVISQKCPDLIKKGPDQVLHTNIYLNLFPRYPLSNKSKEAKVYRVERNLGYTTPENIKYPDPLKIISDEKNADVVIIHDAGNGFRSNEEKWPKVLKENRKPIVIYSMYPPLFVGDLWNYIYKNHKENLILILNAEDLRKIGTNISRSISWEKSAVDFLLEINHKENLAEIKKLTNVIIRFKYEGVIHYRGEKDRSKLYFDPESLEGDFWNSKNLGDMRAVTLVFIATLSSYLISKLNNNKDSSSENGIEKNVITKVLEEGLRKGLINSRNFLIEGYGNKNNRPEIKQTCINIFKNDSINPSQDQDNSSENQSSKSLTDKLADTLLPPVEEIDEPPVEEIDELPVEEIDETSVEEIDEPNEPSDSKNSNSYPWTILKEYIKESNKVSNEKDSNSLEKLAIDIVKNGSSSIEQFPMGKFGKLTTVDRAEIESFRSIKNIMEKYILSEESQKPLSIAVFGSPGSGKSFGITQVAESVDPEIVNITFNISQFTSTKHLTHAFHRIRDISLQGKVPLAFFDEFDCKFQDEELGWIKHFLVPMQDGEFLDCESMHPIGKSIFVFAGGTCDTFEEFCKHYNSSKKNKNSDSKTPESEKFNSKTSDRKTGSCRGISNKCPDFLSRLRGYVNILGPNRVEGKNDEAYTIRRAILLRSIIENNAKKIIDGNGNVHINENLLKALINVPKYKHGVRSMQAIVEMSILSGETSWEKAFLPPKDQLKLHIDNIKEFYALLDHN